MTKSEDLQKLAKLYYDPASGYVGLKPLWKLTQKARLFFLDYEDVKKWLESQEIAQVHKHTRRPKYFQKIRAKAIGQLSGDLMILERFAKVNSNFKYLFNVIDTYSRKIWSFPLKTKTPTEIAPHLRQVLDDVFKNPRMGALVSFATDMGSEFKGQICKVIEQYPWG
jgi:hypothetical protein